MQRKLPCLAKPRNLTGCCDISTSKLGLFWIMKLFCVKNRSIVENGL